MKKILGMFAAAAMMMAAQAASAATTFSFSFSGQADTGGFFSGTGLLFADDGAKQADDSVLYTVTGADGVLTLGDNSTRQITGVGTLDDPVTGQTSQNTILSYGADNVLVQIAFTFANPTDVALFTLNQLDFLYSASAVIDGNAESADGVAFDVAPVPEPATWAMMLLGFALVGGAMRRRRLAVAFAA